MSKKLIIASDGSYIDSDEVCHGGLSMHIVEDGTQVENVELHVTSDDSEFLKMRNVGGELIAAYHGLVTAANFARMNPEEEIEVILVYDYAGVGEWLNGAWKPKKNATKRYKQAVINAIGPVTNISLKFQQVRGHGNVYVNNNADRIAGDRLHLYKEIKVTIPE